jgi:hypothetical protein
MWYLLEFSIQLKKSKINFIRLTKLNSNIYEGYSLQQEVPRKMKTSNVSIPLKEKINYVYKQREALHLV